MGILGSFDGGESWARYRRGIGELRGRWWVNWASWVFVSGSMGWLVGWFVNVVEVTTLEERLVRFAVPLEREVHGCKPRL